MHENNDHFAFCMRTIIIVITVIVIIFPLPFIILYKYNYHHHHRHIKFFLHEPFDTSCLKSCPQCQVKGGEHRCGQQAWICVNVRFSSLVSICELWHVTYIGQILHIHLVLSKVCTVNNWCSADVIPMQYQACPNAESMHAAHKSEIYRIQHRYSRAGEQNTVEMCHTLLGTH